MICLREAIEASWDASTAYQALVQPGNPAYAQCYPTSRVVQHFFPEMELVEGTVWTGNSEEHHYWNVVRIGDNWHHIDLTWRQFPVGSVVREFTVLDRRKEGPSKRTAILLRRVEERMAETIRDQ
jgi:hypothetical protein